MRANGDSLKRRQAPGGRRQQRETVFSWRYPPWSIWKIQARFVLSIGRVMLL